MAEGEFGTLVRRIRDVRGITQEQLARELEVTFSTVNGWENGRHRPIPSLERRVREIAEAAGIPMALPASGQAPPARRAPKRRR